MSKIKSFIKKLFPETPAGKPTFEEPRDKQQWLTYLLNKNLMELCPFHTFTPVDAEVQYGRAGQVALYLNVERNGIQQSPGTIPGAIKRNVETARRYYETDFIVFKLARIAYNAESGDSGAIGDYISFDGDGNLKINIYVRFKTNFTDKYGRVESTYEVHDQYLEYTVAKDELMKIASVQRADLKAIFNFKVKPLP